MASRHLAIGDDSVSSIFWFRRDVRLDDHPGLAAAANQGPVLALFVLDPALIERVSERRRNALLAGLRHLDSQIAERGGNLLVVDGDPEVEVPKVAESHGIERVHVSAEVTPFAKRRDAAVADQVDLIEHSGIYVHSPGSVLTNEGEPYKVFSPFYKKWATLDATPLEIPEDLQFVPQSPPDIPNSDGAHGPHRLPDLLEDFLEKVDNYERDRNQIDLDVTSHLSVALKYGWIGPRHLVSAIGTGTPGRQSFVRQVAWRDFYAHVLADNPRMVDQELDSRFSDLSWRNEEDDIQAWKEGKTGYPLVDAAMRCLVATGYIHGRARLVVASFLVKHLLVDWRVGEAFFRHHLIDGDTPQNVGNWQWVASTGTDASPYFRIFNPITQSEKFDPDGDFIRRWVPELANLDSGQIHEPWEVPPLELAEADVYLGDNYPTPIVDHAEARERALETYSAAAGS